MTSKIHFALIGAGRMGKRWVSVMSNYDSVSLEVIVSTRLKTAKSLANEIPKCIPTENIKDVLENKNIDAIIIATPHKYLSSITSLGLRSGKHVLCEKQGEIKSRKIKKNRF